MVMVNQIIHLWGGNRQQSEVFSVCFAVLARLQLNSFIARVRMEDMSQEKRQELETENQKEEEGGIRRRLRDRDLLRKRKAEAEEKETNQVESQRKRSRAENKSGTKKRGRPRKTEPMLQLLEVQEQAAATQEGPAVIVAPEPTIVISDQVSGSLTSILAKESQPASFPAAAAPAQVLKSSIFAPTLTSPASVNSTLDISSAPVQDSALDPAPFPAPAQVLAPAPDPFTVPALTQDSAPASVLATAPAPDAFTVPVLTQDSAPAEVLAPAPDAFTVPALTQDSAPAAVLAPPIAPPQVENLYTESQAREALDQVLIEDLGPDEEQDIPPSQDSRADEGLNETVLTSVPEQTKMYSVPTLSSASLPQEYFPGN